MTKPLAGIQVAVLVANGFCEQDMTEAQRALLSAGASIRVIGMDHGLVNSWHGQGWGHHFAIDKPLGSALAADYDMLVLPGGRRSLDKLKLTAHTRRFIGGFMSARKPVVVYGRAIQLLVFADQVRGRAVTGPEDLMLDVTRAAGNWSEESCVRDSALLTGRTDREGDRAMLVEAMMTHFGEFAALLAAARAPACAA